MTSLQTVTAVTTPTAVVLASDGIGRHTEALSIKAIKNIFGNGDVIILRNAKDLENYADWGKPAHFAFTFFADGMDEELTMLAHEFFDIKSIRKMEKFLIVQNDIRMTSLDSENFSNDHVVPIEFNDEQNIFASIQRAVGEPEVFYTDNPEVLDLSRASSEAIAAAAKKKGAQFRRGDAITWADSLPGGAQGLKHSLDRRAKREEASQNSFH